MLRQALLDNFVNDELVSMLISIHSQWTRSAGRGLQECHIRRGVWDHCSIDTAHLSEYRQRTSHSNQCIYLQQGVLQGRCAVKIYGPSFYIEHTRMLRLQFWEPLRRSSRDWFFKKVGKVWVAQKFTSANTTTYTTSNYTQAAAQRASRGRVGRRGATVSNPPRGKDNYHGKVRGGVFFLRWQEAGR